MDIDTLGTLKHINIRKEGKSEKILAVDLKLVAEISADALIEFHPTLRSWLWDPYGNPRFNTLIDSIDLLGTLNDHAVKVNDIRPITRRRRDESPWWRPSKQPRHPSRRRRGRSTSTLHSCSASTSPAACTWARTCSLPLTPLNWAGS